MKTKMNILFIVTLVSGMLMAGCVRAEQYGQALSEQETTEIIEILKDPASFMGKTVKLKGKISTECPAGCWFNVSDDIATLYVDLAGANLAIPQKVGHDVIVEGTIVDRAGTPMLAGAGVEIK